VAFVDRIPHHYAHHFQDPRRERMFISSLGFLGGFAIARVITHAIRSQVGPFKNLSVGGHHLHHLVFGIGGLLGAGYLWLTGVGTPQGGRAASRTTSALYGLASALTLDEFALWLNLEDVYWAREGRVSIDAVVLFGGLLSVGLWGSPFFNAVARDLLGRPAHPGGPILA
jgi:uncharacterized membrane protein YdcZ (DUF606 family)